MNSQLVKSISADCENCFGLCCVALPFAKSADFAIDKDGGTPCRNLNSNYRCDIHQNLRHKGYKGCTVYECFGAGQKVSQITYNGNDWREYPETANEMFNVFPIMQQLHEILYYLFEALSIKEAEPIYEELRMAIDKTEELTIRKPEDILSLHVSDHRTTINKLLLQVSELVRSRVNRKTKGRKRIEYIGAKLKGADLSGTDFRGSLLIAADLRNADLRKCDFIGADMRDANLSGANLSGSIFLTQAQVNAANGDSNTKLPSTLKRPQHWLS
ncbi:pentapeptide repeat-containing protein [Fredinandcohnia sp. 179-A 10B2 NHS]|uniref:pentapeptide repeat-containing protein n=1 Tax=Fredinandcohnia sp. 179-A 10B2 NHS TaxID=3235176 RepID=UPI00399FAB49